jgi:hypothetical protein
MGKPTQAVCAPVKPSRKAASVLMSGDFHLSVNSPHNNSSAVCLNLQAIAAFHREALSDALAGF